MSNFLIFMKAHLLLQLYRELGWFQICFLRCKCLLSDWWKLTVCGIACMLLCSCFRFWNNSEFTNICLLLFVIKKIFTPWHYSSFRTLAASHILCEVSWQKICTGWGRQPHAQPPTWRTRVSLLVWHLPRNLSGMGGRTSTYVATGIGLEFIGAHKAPHPATECFRQGGDTIEGEPWK
jgi:hypothetical protein